MNAGQRSTWRAIFEVPTRSSIRWSDIESLLKALGARVEEGSGSRIRVALAGKRAVFHRPHPRPETKKGTVDAVRRFIISAGVREYD